VRKPLKHPQLLLAFVKFHFYIENTSIKAKFLIKVNNTIRGALFNELVINSALKVKRRREFDRLFSKQHVSATLEHCAANNFSKHDDII
jgi:hypothetical protein